MSYQITKTKNTVTINFDEKYFFSNCNNATTDFDELEIEPIFTFTFIDDKPVLHDEPIFDQSHIEQLFNYDILAALITADPRFDNDENPY
jgi:hypothetical protein